MNRHWQRPTLQAKRVATEAKHQPYAVTPTIAHPHRALPPGQTWLPHERANSKSAARRRKQMARDRANTLQRQYGSTSVVAREGDALILDLPGPTRILPSPHEGRS